MYLHHIDTIIVFSVADYDGLSEENNNRDNIPSAIKPTVSRYVFIEQLYSGEILFRLTFTYGTYQLSIIYVHHFIALFN